MFLQDLTGCTSKRMNFFYIYLIIFFIIIPLINRRNKIRRQRMIRKRKIARGEKTLAAKILEECIGKQATIMVEGELAGFSATVLAVDENIIKIEDKKTIRYINADMISQIQLKK